MTHLLFWFSILIQLLAFHDALDVVSVHKALLDEFTAVVANMRGRRSLDTQVDTLIQEKASLLSEKPELTNVCVLEISSISDSV